MVQQSHFANITLLVANFIDQGTCRFPDYITEVVPNIQFKVLHITLPLDLRDDCRTWPHSSFGAEYYVVMLNIKY